MLNVEVQTHIFLQLAHSNNRCNQRNKLFTHVADIVYEIDNSPEFFM